MLRSMMEYFLSSINRRANGTYHIGHSMSIEGFIAAGYHENAHCIAGLGEGELDVFAALPLPCAPSHQQVCSAGFFCF